jgi:hypothetical protein
MVVRELQKAQLAEYFATGINVRSTARVAMPPGCETKQGGSESAEKYHANPHDEKHIARIAVESRRAGDAVEG